jgi:hypothetical protein
MAKTYNIPIFDISVDEEGMGLFGLSFVDNPAIQVELHAFKAEEAQKVFFASHEKREVVSPVMIPNQLIIREAMGIPYYMRASEETIRKMYEKYMLSGNWNNFTYMHENMDADISERVKEGIYLQRLWIIEDEKNDDACTKYGFTDLPKGTLMMKCKVNNRQIWNEIKEGKLRGISLEAFFDKINTNKALQITYSKMKTKLELFQKFIAFLNEVSVEADGVATEAQKDETNSGIVELKYYLDDEHYFTVDAEGIVRDENLNVVEMGDYRLADGNIFSVGEGGKFIETKAVEEDENKVEAPIAETFEEEEKKDEEDKEDEGKAEGEDKSDDAESDAEDVPVDDGKSDEDGTKEDGEDDEKDKLEDEEPKKEEDEEEKPMVNAVPYSINGVEYVLPVEVVSFIESLITSKVEVEEKLTEMAEQTPSAMPIGTVVKTAEDNADDINTRVSMFSSFKGFRHRV